jgi:hypothetical protein
MVKLQMKMTFVKKGTMIFYRHHDFHVFLHILCAQMCSEKDTNVNLCKICKWRSSQTLVASASLSLVVLLGMNLTNDGTRSVFL